MFLLAVFAAALAGGCTDKTRVAAESARVEIHESGRVAADVVWDPVGKAYDASMFTMNEIVVDDATVKVLGVRPDLDYFVRSAGECQHASITVAVFSVGSRHNSWLFVKVVNGTASCAMVSDVQSPAFAGRIDFREVLAGSEKDFVQAASGAVFVERHFWQDLKDRGVKLPGRNIPLPEIQWDSQKSRSH